MRILCGDATEVLRTLPAESIQCCVTSPPYFGLRDYGVEGQIGLEATPEAYVERLVGVFREVRRVLRDDGTLWLNLGDSYASNGGKTQPHRDSSGGMGKKGTRGEQGYHAAGGGFIRPDTARDGLKPKDLIGIPWRVAFALQADGWYLRQDIIWHKPNPMPESVQDRCTKAHEYMFLLSKSERYFFNSEAMKEKAAGVRGGAPKKIHSESAQGKHGATSALNKSWDGAETRNRRSVWTVASSRYGGAHFAAFPPALIEPCILAGAPFNGLVLDPFTGSGTTAAVALQHGRRFIGCELNPDYIKLAEARIAAAEAEVLW